MANIGLYGQLIRKSSGDTIDADLLKGVAGRVVVTSIGYDTTTRVLTIGYMDENNDPQEEIVTVELTDAELHDLNSIPGLLDKTSDLLVEVTAREWTTNTDVNLGAFASENSGNLGPSHASALNYFVSLTPTASQTGNDYVYIRIPTNRDARDYRIRQDGSLGEFFITSWSHVGTHEDFEYYRSRHNLFEGYQVTIQYDAATAIQTTYRGKIDQSDWNETDADENAFILNKPTIPDDNVQSDWDETDNTSDAFIQNISQVKAQLADIPNLEAKTGDLIVHTTRTWANATDAEVTGFAGRPATLADIVGETYHTSLTQGVAEDYIVIRIPLANDLRDYRINQTDAGFEHDWQHLELIDIDTNYRYGGTFVHIVGWQHD